MNTNYVFHQTYLMNHIRSFLPTKIPSKHKNKYKKILSNISKPLGICIHCDNVLTTFDYSWWKDQKYQLIRRFGLYTYTHYNPWEDRFCEYCLNISGNAICISCNSFDKKICRCCNTCDDCKYDRLDCEEYLY